jgi:hypothetical protein
MSWAKKRVFPGADENLAQEVRPEKPGDPDETKGGIPHES